jgi:hypothetical protein
MNPREVVVLKVDCLRGHVVVDLLAKRVGQPRGKRRMPIRIDRLRRSTWLVEMCATSGLPVIHCVCVPMQTAGL